MVVALGCEDAAFPRCGQPTHELIVRQLQSVLHLVFDRDYDSLLAVLDAVDGKIFDLKIAIAAKSCLPSCLALRWLDGLEIMPHRAGIITPIGQLILKSDNAVAADPRFAVDIERIRLNWIVRDSHKLWISPLQHGRL